MSYKQHSIQNTSVIGHTTETERGASAYLDGYHGGISSLRNRISHRLSARIGLKTYPMNLRRPMISFTFDDIAQSAALIGATELEKYDARGTFYIATDLMGRHISGSQKATREEIKTIYDAGHEIGLHSHSHLPAFSYSNFGFKADLKDNIDILSEFIKLEDNPNYCYPYGVTTFQAKLRVRSMSRSARCIWDDINHTRLDPYFLRSSLLDSSAISFDGIEKLILHTKEKNGWLIVISHGVEEANEALSTPLSYLKHAISLAQQHNFEIKTVSQGLNHLSIP